MELVLCVPATQKSSHVSDNENKAAKKDEKKRTREEVHLSIVWIKEDWSTDGSMPSVGSQGPPIAMREWSFLRTANFNMLHIWGKRSSNNLSDERSSRAVLLSPLINIIWTTEETNYTRANFFSIHLESIAASIQWEKSTTAHLGVPNGLSFSFQC